MDEMQAFQMMADRIGDYIWNHSIKQKLKSLGMVGSFFATVSSAASGGKIGVVKQFDEDAAGNAVTQYLPYAASAASVSVGTVVLVLWFGGPDNAVVMGPYNLSNL